MFRISPELFEDFSCLLSWDTETTTNSPELPAIFQSQILKQIQRKSHKVFWRADKTKLRRIHLVVMTDVAMDSLAQKGRIMRHILWRFVLCFSCGSSIPHSLPSDKGHTITEVPPIQKYYLQFLNSWIIASELHDGNITSCPQSSLECCDRLPSRQ